MYNYNYTLYDTDIEAQRCYNEVNLGVIDREDETLEQRNAIIEDAYDRYMDQEINMSQTCCVCLYSLCILCYFSACFYFT